MGALIEQQTELVAVCRRRLDAGEGLITMLDDLRAMSATQHDPPLTDDQVLKVISHVTRERGDAEAISEALRAEAEQPIPLTDLGNAERLVLAHGHELRFVPGLGWHAWDGRRFKRDTDGAVMRRMAQTARAIYAEAAGERDSDRRKAIAKHATTSESEPSLRRAVSLAQNFEQVIAQPDDLDADPWILNAANGVVDLKTGVLLPHDPSRLCTKITGGDFDGAAVHPAWERVIDAATGGDRELEGFLRRAAGVTCIGESVEQRLLFPHGPGATGKSTLMAAMKSALGEYAVQADFDTFIARRDSGGARSDLARLAGARMVLGVEVDDGKRLAESVLKQLTGGDVVTARFLYSDFFEYTPRFTLWLAANRRPAVDAQDDAMWRRITQIPFTNVIPVEKRDPAIMHTLVHDPDARAAVIAWMVRGCIEWQEQGLGVPAVVTAYTRDYREENDPLAVWLADSTRPNPAASESSKDLRASYEQWAQDNGERPVTPKKFAASMRSHGFEPGKGTGGVRLWHGIALSTPSVASVAPQTPISGNVPKHTHARGFTDPGAPGAPGAPGGDGDRVPMGPNPVTVTAQPADSNRVPSSNGALLVDSDELLSRRAERLEARYGHDLDAA